jgi:hypothetical protein
MATNAQIDANRANARHSTGPRTPAGIAACKLNALKHGLTAQHAVIPGEDPEAYEALRSSFIDTYAPADEAEAMLVERLSISWWKLRRADITHARMVERMGLPEDAFLHRETAEMCRNFQRHYTSVERAWRSAHDQLGRILAARAKSPAPRVPATTTGPVQIAEPPPLAKPAQIGSVLHAVPPVARNTAGQPYQDDGKLPNIGLQQNPAAKK